VKLKLAVRVQWRVSGKEGIANDNGLVFCSLASKLLMQLEFKYQRTSSSMEWFVSSEFLVVGCC
jgi:hypothetical protein